MIPSKRPQRRKNNAPFTSAWMHLVLFFTSGSHLFCPETSAGAVDIRWRQQSWQAWWDLGPSSLLVRPGFVGSKKRTRFPTGWWVQVDQLRSQSNKPKMPLQWGLVGGGSLCCKNESFILRPEKKTSGSALCGISFLMGPSTKCLFVECICVYD